MADEPRVEHGAPLIRCNQCGHEVPRLEFCVRCGDPLRDEYSVEAQREQRSRFAAAPDESARTVAIVSTLFPQLPRTEMRAFRAALIAGIAAVVAIALLGFFPVALVVAAVLVPLLMVLYLWFIDIYEDEPIPVIGATMAWGAVAGIVFGLVMRTFQRESGLDAPGVESVILNGVG